MAKAPQDSSQSIVGGCCGIVRQVETPSRRWTKSKSGGGNRHPPVAFRASGDQIGAAGLSPAAAHHSRKKRGKMVGRRRQDRQAAKSPRIPAACGVRQVLSVLVLGGCTTSTTTSEHQGPTTGSRAHQTPAALSTTHWTPAIESGLGRGLGSSRSSATLADTHPLSLPPPIGWMGPAQTGLRLGTSLPVIGRCELPPLHWEGNCAGFCRGVSANPILHFPLLDGPPGGMESKARGKQVQVQVQVVVVGSRRSSMVVVVSMGLRRDELGCSRVCPVSAAGDETANS